MNVTLIVFKLSIQSSYVEDAEADADEEDFDTVQFFVSAESAWRVRTFSIDEDVHVYSLGETKPDTLEVVTTSTERTYSDIIVAKAVFQSQTGIEGLKQELERNGWSPTLKVSGKHGFAFWVPPDSDYRTKSTPEA